MQERDGLYKKVNKPLFFLNPILGNYMIDTDEESPSISEEKLTHETLDRKKAEFCTFNRYVSPCYGSVFKTAGCVSCFGVRDAR